MDLQQEIEKLVEAILHQIGQARKELYQVTNQKMVSTYWNIGRLIVEGEQKGSNRAAYGSQQMEQLSKRLTTSLGKGFSLTNLFNMRIFYQCYPTFQTVSGKLSWSHYCELVSIEDKQKRSFYEQEALKSNWSIRELKRQLESSLYERLLLSSGEVNQSKVLELSKSGHIIEKPSDLIKDPYVFDFLGIPESKPMLEKDLEQKLIRHIEDFLLELGKGFMYVGSQQRITLGNEHYYVDMVFYNKILKAYVLIDLKVRKLKHTDIGQMNTYLNYYKAEVNEVSDSDPIGIILCTDKNELEAKYALGGLNNQMFASKYVYHLPDKEMLIQEVQRALLDK